jgi:uncharacterized protein (TIGR00299 family) protein
VVQRRAIYFDCFAGASGDMLLGALIDAGADRQALETGLRSLGLDGWTLEVGEARQGALRGLRATVRLERDVEQPHRHLSDVAQIVNRSTLPPTVRERALRVYSALTDAEAQVHGVSAQDVELHEVGAVDSIVDIVGSCLALHLLGDPEVYSSGLPLGQGWVRSMHGPLPIPGPATLELMRAAAAPMRVPPRAGEVGELTTPTATAWLTTLATFKAPMFEAVEKVGYGFGQREPDWPNALRAWVGTVQESPLLRDEIVVVETNLDDITAEQLGYAMERLLEAGALDVSFSPLQMKKNRPGTLLKVLTQPAREEEMAELVMRHTSALGVRLQRTDRLIAARAESSVETRWGSVRVKEKHLGHRIVSGPEFEDCARLAREHDVTLAEVYQAALDAVARDRGQSEADLGHAQPHSHEGHGH